MITEDKLNELRMFHEQWLHHPVTKQLQQILKGHIERVESSFADEGIGVGTESDSKLRNLSIQLKSHMTILTLISNTETFVAKATNNQTK